MLESESSTTSNTETISIAMSHETLRKPTQNI